MYFWLAFFNDALEDSDGRPVPLLAGHADRRDPQWMRIASAGLGFSEDGFLGLFIGSMNFDQRSMRLNTEVGLIIDGPELAQQLAARFEAMVQPVNSYKPALRPNGSGGAPDLVWQSQEDGKAVVYDTEPARSDWQRFEVHVLSLLPLDKEL